MPCVNWKQDRCQCSKESPPSLRIIEQRKRGVVSSDFIRIKMAEAIPPDKAQLVGVGELG